MSERATNIPPMIAGVFQWLCEALPDAVLMQPLTLSRDGMALFLLLGRNPREDYRLQG